MPNVPRTVAPQVTRATQEAAQKAASMAERNVLHKENRENRETMMKRLADDATMRKEPGWKAQVTLNLTLALIPT